MLSKEDIYKLENLEQTVDMDRRRAWNQVHRQRLKNIRRQQSANRIAFRPRKLLGGAGHIKPFTLELDGTLYCIYKELQKGAGGDGMYLGLVTDEREICSERSAKLAREKRSLAAKNKAGDFGEVVLKRIPSRDDKFRSYFTIEVSVLKRLGRHENIIEFVASHEDKINNYCYIVCKYANQGDLFNAVYTGNLDLKAPARVKVFEQIVEGLHYAHERGIAHRDIKPENIFLHRNTDLNIKRRVLIGDWAFATTDTLSTKPKGTPEYISPAILLCANLNRVRRLNQSLKPEQLGRLVSNSLSPREKFLMQQLHPDDRKKELTLKVEEMRDKLMGQLDVLERLGMKQETAPAYSPKKADVWALGILFCEMMIARPIRIFEPYEQNSLCPTETMCGQLEKVKKNDWDAFWARVYPKPRHENRGLNERWMGWIEKMLAYEDEERTTLAAIHADIHAVPSVKRQKFTIA